MVGRIWSWFRNHWSGISAPQNLEGGGRVGPPLPFSRLETFSALVTFPFPQQPLALPSFPFLFLHGSWGYQRGCSFLVTCAAALRVLLKACFFSSLHILQSVCPTIYIYAIDNWCNIWIQSFISILFVSKSKPLSHFLENRVRMKSRFLSNILGSLLATRASCESHRLWHNTRGEGWLLGRKRVGGLGRCAISVKLQLTGWQGRGCAIIHNFSEFEKSCQTICAVTLPEDSFS